MNVDRICTHCMQESFTSPGMPCPFCGHPFRNANAEPHQLQPLTRLQQGKYLVGDVLGEGGFGITYIGYDLNLEYKVAIKEFFPGDYVARNSFASDVMEILPGPAETAVETWRENFLSEARTLAKCTRLPGIVNVRDFFNQNNTAYIILEYLEGKTLRGLAETCGGRLAPDYLLPMLEPVILSLGEMHRLGLIHRDISPDNIMLLPDASMKILDFGSAKNYFETREFPVMVKPGYSPEEQYRTDGVQGPWTDVYALSATLYKLFTGVTPPDARERMTQETLVPPNQYGAGLNANQEMAILNGLVVYYNYRVQTMEDFHDALYRGSNYPMSPQMSEFLDSVGNMSVKAVDKVTEIGAGVGKGVANFFKKHLK